MSVPVLAFAGATRDASYNKRLVRLGAEAARAAGATVTLIDLRDFPLPLYDGDLETRDGLPEPARRLKALFLANRALLIATPEYNGGMTAVLKNAIDWVSRSAPGEAPLSAFRGKVAGLLAASPGGLGAMRSLMQTRAVLQATGVLVIPENRTVGQAASAFDDDGRLRDPAAQAAVERVASRLVDVAARLAG